MGEKHIAYVNTKFNYYDKIYAGNETKPVICQKKIKIVNICKRLYNV